MGSVVEEDQTPRLFDGARRKRSRVGAAGGIALCFLLSLLQVSYAGYQLGFGNQPIQITFLNRWADPTLFPTDEMVRQTIGQYPSLFFRMLAPLLHLSGIEPLYLMLQLLTAFATLAAVYLLARSIFKSHAAAIAAACLLVAGHQRALALEGTYTPFFTHTLAALPLALLAIALVYRGRIMWAMALAGVLFNMHALTAAYALLMIAMATLADVNWRDRTTWWRWAKTVAIGGAIFAALASPTLVQMAMLRGQHFDQAWLNLMRVRSADHSFPSTWWATGNPDIPRFALIFALFVLSWSFSPVRRGGDETSRALRMTVWMTIAVGLLFAAGYLFSEVWPVPTVIRLQPFRASRLLLVLMLVHIAYGAVEGIRAGIVGRCKTNDLKPKEHKETQTSQSPEDMAEVRLAWAARAMEMLAGVMVLATLAVPAWLPLLPLTVVAVIAASLLSGRLSGLQVLVAVASLALAILAWRQIQFAIPGLSSNVALWPGRLDDLALQLAFAAAVLTVLLAAARTPWLRAAVMGAALLIGATGSWLIFAQEISADRSEKSLANDLRGVSRWAKEKTAKGTVFLAPTGLSAFRIFSQRGLVGDWRDGTQLYFSASFGPEWMARLTAVEPGLLLSDQGDRVVARGKSLATLDDDELIALAKKFDAAYVLLPTPPKTNPRTLQVAFSDTHFTAYLPKSQTTIPKGVVNPAEWTAMEKFMSTTVAQNIETYRKAQLTVQIVDPTGRPVQDLPVKLDQTSHAFYFGCSMSYFGPIKDSWVDQHPPTMKPEELKLIPTLFNASMPGFTGKWMFLEPNDGEKNFGEMDKYIDFCQANHMAVEFHYLTGLLPDWLRKNQKLAEQRLPEHAREIVARYHDKVAFWQIENDGYLVNATPPVFKELHETYPGIKLGISDCTKFYCESKDPRRIEHDMYKGFDHLVWLKTQGAQPDFFSLHGHQPTGLWADPRVMYEVFDRFAKEGVKVHVSEALVPIGGEMVGGVRKGKWSTALQADYLERFMTVCFSHPAMEMVNLWGIGPQGWGGSGGLVDPDTKPRPALQRLQKLLNETWHTKLETQLPLDGIVSTRAFHGTYRLSVKLPDGREVVTELALPTGKEAAFKYCLDEKTGTLTQISN